MALPKAAAQAPRPDARTVPAARGAHVEGGPARKPRAGAIEPEQRTSSRAGGSPGKVSVFISYARDDHLIATALFEELSDINRDRVECFLDTKAIELGEGWEKKLERALGQADWLVCVYTGEQSEFCGYEIGVFTGGKALEKTDDSRLVCLHDVASYPTVFHHHQNRLVTLPPEGAPPGQPSNETDFYTNSELAKFLQDFCKYRDLYVPRDASGYQRQAQMIVSKAKRISEAFHAARGADVRADTPTQLGIEVSVPWPAGKPLPSIPLEALAKGTYQSFGLFGLMPYMEGQQLPVAQWAEIKATGRRRGNGYLLWIERLERDMVDAANKRALGDAEATFRAKDKTFRAILVRHSLLWNGTHKFEIAFVETLPRQFIGDRNTSLILAGLVMASRFRFAYFEDPAAVSERFTDALSDPEFEANFRQFLYDLERMRQELMELGLLDETAFVQSFGPTRRGLAEVFLKTWSDARQALERDLPDPDAGIGPATRRTARQAIASFLTAMETENRRFLLTAMDAYRDELNAELQARPGGKRSASTRAEADLVGPGG